MSPGDFLPGFVGSRRVVDRHFHDTSPLPHQFTDQFVVELEPPGLDGRRSNHGPSESLVATFVIGEPPSIQQIRDGRDEHVADVMGEIRRPARTDEFRLVENEPGAHHHVAAPIHDRPYDGRVVVRILFQVCILDDDIVARRGLEAGSERRALAGVPLMRDMPDGRQPFQDLLRSIL